MLKQLRGEVWIAVLFEKISLSTLLFFHSFSLLLLSLLFSILVPTLLKIISYEIKRVAHEGF